MSRKFRSAVAVAALSFGYLAPAAVHAAENPRIDEKALTILKEMSDYIGAAETFTFKGAARYEYVLNTGQKIEFGENISVAVKRPKGIRAEVDGDVVARMFWFDGKRASIYDPDSGRYAQTDLSGDIDAAVRTLIEKHGLTAPLADFVLKNSYKVLTDGLDSATYVGIGEVQGVLCHHLAFRHDDRVDWQLWIDAGTSRVPRRFAISYTSVAGQPEYRANLSDWSFYERFPQGLFTFEPPEGTLEVEFDDAVLRRSSR